MGVVFLGSCICGRVWVGGWWLVRVGIDVGFDAWLRVGVVVGGCWLEWVLM